MFELGRKPSQVILIVFLDQKSQKSQRISIPTDRQTLSMHRYLLIESHRRSVGTTLHANKNEVNNMKSTCPMQTIYHQITLGPGLGARCFTLGAQCFVSIGIGMLVSVMRKSCVGIGLPTQGSNAIPFTFWWHI